MPKVSVWLVRCAFLSLVVGVTIGTMIMLDDAVGILPFTGGLRLVHGDLLLGGWLMQLAFGVGSWILPFGRGQTKDCRLWAVLLLINLAMVMLIAGAFIPSIVGLPLLARMAVIVAALLFGWHVWSRLRPLRRQSRD